MFRKRKIEEPINYGLVESDRPPPGCIYEAIGKIQGFPYTYSLKAFPVVRSREPEETAILYSEILSAIARMERRDEYQVAIYALFGRGTPNIWIELIATTSKGKRIVLLSSGISIRIAYRDTRSTVIRLCRFIKVVAETMHDDTGKLDPVSATAIRGALLYESPVTKQFWLNTIISAWVGLIN